MNDYIRGLRKAKEIAVEHGEEDTEKSLEKLIQSEYDNALTEYAKTEFKRFLSAGRNAGRHSWFDAEVLREDQLKDLLADRIKEEDYELIALYAMMLAFRRTPDASQA